MKPLSSARKRSEKAGDKANSEGKEPCQSQERAERQGRKEVILQKQSEDKVGGA